MVLLELAAQSVRGFTPSVRVALKPGYIGLKSPSEIPAPLGGLISALCFPDGRGGDAAFLAPGARAGRAGLSIQSNDQTVWRLVRDLGGQGGLHKLNPATNQYELVTQEAADLAQAIRGQVGFPSRATFEQVFCFNGPQLPSRRPRLARAAAPTKPQQKKVQSTAFDEYTQAEDPGQVTQRLAQLERELVAAREAAELQFKMDGLQADVFKYETRLRAYQDLKQKVQEARAGLASAASPKSLGLPDDIVDRVRRFSDEKRKRDLALAKLEEERQSAIGDGVAGVAPLHKDQRFWMALVAGLGLLIAPAFLEGYARYLALLSVPAFTLATLVALRFIEDLQARSRELAKAEVFAVREKKIQDDFSLANSVVQTAFEKTNTATADDFAAVLAAGQQLAPQVGELELELADFESDPELSELPVKIAELKGEFEECNAKLLKMSGGYVREAREIERDMGRLKAILSPTQPTEDFAAVATGPSETFEDPMPGVLALGTDLFATDVPTLWAVLRDRSVQYLKALSDQRYHGIDIASDGRATIQAPGRAVGAGELPPKDLDLLYLSVRLTLVEKYSGQNKIPVILEDSFATVFEGPKQALVGRMLKHIGSLTQVLHVTGQGQNVSAADFVVNI